MHIPITTLDIMDKLIGKQIIIAMLKQLIVKKNTTSVCLCVIRQWKHPTSTAIGHKDNYRVNNLVAKPSPKE